MENIDLTERVTKALDDEGWRAWLPSTKRGAIGAVPFLAVILWAVSDEDSEKKTDTQIVDAWARQMVDATARRVAVLGGRGSTRAVIPHDPVTFLELPTLPLDWNWLLSIDDADSFLESKGMGFSCSGVLACWHEHVYPEPHAPAGNEAGALWTPERLAQLLADFNAAPGKTVKERRANLAKNWQTGDANLKKYLARAKKDAEASKPGYPWAGLKKVTR